MQSYLATSPKREGLPNIAYTHAMLRPRQSWRRVGLRIRALFSAKHCQCAARCCMCLSHVGGSPWKPIFDISAGCWLSVDLPKRPRCAAIPSTVGQDIYNTVAVAMMKLQKKKNAQSDRKWNTMPASTVAVVTKTKTGQGFGWAHPCTTRHVTIPGARFHFSG